jgi:hypothetical protein
MYTRLLVVVIATMLVAVAYQVGSAMHAPQTAVPRPEDSGGGSNRIGQPDYDRLAKRAQAGDCDAAYRVARHHHFFSMNVDEAIRFYRIAAKCPDVNAKEALIIILMHFSEADAEVDKLLLQMDGLEPERAAAIRKEIAANRARR